MLSAINLKLLSYSLFFLHIVNEVVYILFLQCRIQPKNKSHENTLQLSLYPQATSTQESRQAESVSVETSLALTALRKTATVLVRETCMIYTSRVPGSRGVEVVGRTVSTPHSQNVRRLFVNIVSPSACQIARRSTEIIAEW